MKRRHLNILALGMMAAAVSAAAAGWGFPRRAPAPTARIQGSLSLPTPPDPEVLKSMAKLEQEMALLGLYRPTDLSPTPLTLFGHQGEVDVRGKGARLVAGVPPAFDYQVSLAFSGGTKRFCVVEGRFLKEGDALSDGGRILRIESKRVLIRKQDFAVWIPVDAAVHPESSEEGKTGGKR